jgi:metal-responsive CopG/Arc/MetJ family transcriptional regulator
VKTAISIPDALFEAADRLARRLSITRSELYARAIEQLLAGQSDSDVTARLNEVYTSQAASLDPRLAAAQRRALDDRW